MDMDDVRLPSLCLDDSQKRMENRFTILIPGYPDVHDAHAPIFRIISHSIPLPSGNEHFTAQSDYPGIQLLAVALDATHDMRYPASTGNKDFSHKKSLIPLIR